jgi:hypothetical protein
MQTGFMYISLGLYRQMCTERETGNFNVYNIRCAYGLEIWEPQTPGTLRAYLGL